MPRRKDYAALDRPAVSWAYTPASYNGPRVIRVHAGIIQSAADLNAFKKLLDAYVNQQSTDYKRK